MASAARDSNRLTGLMDPLLDQRLDPEVLNPTDLQDNSAVRVLILYEDKGTGCRAKRALDILGKYLLAGEKLETHSTIWRFDLLGDKLFFQEAMRAGAEADIVLLSGHGEWGMPEAVGTWLSWWLSRNTDAPPALVALLDECAGDSPGEHQFLSSLQVAANLNGIPVFAHFGDFPLREVCSGMENPATCRIKSSGFHDFQS